MITINGHNFYEIPTSCGTCPFLITDNTNAPIPVPQTDRGHCIQWDEWHHTWAAPPRRCAKLFKQAFKLYDNIGQKLVITYKEK